MKGFADTVLTMWQESPQTFIVAAMAVLMCVGLYQLIRMNSEIHKITEKIKKYLDTVMVEEDMPQREDAGQGAAVNQADYKRMLSAQLTPEETQMLLAEDDSAARESKKKHDEAIFNEVLQEYF